MSSLDLKTVYKYSSAVPKRKSPRISEAFLKRVDHWVGRTQLKPSGVRIRHMTALWAVCHVDESITFSRALLDQPEAFQDLVIVHELIHLSIPDHSKWFFLALSIYLPDWRATARLAPETPAELTRRYRVQDLSQGTYRVSSRSPDLSRLTASQTAS